MSDRPDRDLLNEWQTAMQSVAHTIASTAGGGTDATRRLLSPLQRQAELFQEMLEAERRVQRDVLGRALQPLDAVFELLEQSGAAMRGQAELFERTIQVLREPSRRLELAAGIEPSSRRSRALRAEP